MAAPSSNAPLTSPVCVVGPQFCAPNHPIDLTVMKKVWNMTDGNFDVSDVNGNILFKVKGTFSLRDRRVLLDAAGNPLVTMELKLRGAHVRWRAYKGESRNENDLLFTVKKSPCLQFKTQLAVFLAGNTSKEEVCDFKIKGSSFDKACTIYLGDTTTIVAQMNMKVNVQNVLLGKDTYMVTVYPNVDYAFIVALIVIMNGIIINGY